jgi:hypothetical protein
LEILEAGGRVIRSYSSVDSIQTPDPALDPVAYTKLCQGNPAAADCTLPFYWPAPQRRLGTRVGLHRFLWDMRYQPIGDNPRVGEVDATGAVPHRSEHSAPTPGRYTARLTVNGKAYTQPLTLRLDPRVRAPAAGLRQLAALSREMYDLAVAAHDAYQQARARADSVSGSVRAQIDSLAPPAGAQPRPRRGGGGGGRTARAAGARPTLASASQAALAAALAMQDADVTPTAGQVAACARARAQANAVLAQWRRLKTKR